MSLSHSAPLVYVVEDDEALRDSLEWLLASAGYRVAAYPTAEAFLGSYAATAGSCLVLDVQLPGMSGLELHQELRQAEHALPVIFITGHATEYAKFGALKDGAAYFLDKPCLDERLLALLDKIVSRAASSR